MISISGLQKSFGSFDVLIDVTLSIESGDIFGLVGRSGAGKSTLLRCINGLETFDEGSLVVAGQEMSLLKTEKEIRSFRKNIGMIFQHFSLAERCTVYENIALPMKWWRYDKKQIDARVAELLSVVGLEDKKNMKPRALSGGQKQRVAIARALSLNPSILLCDEATSALDPNTTKSILALLRKINRELGITIVVVTHQMSVVRDVCNKIAILEKGRIAAMGKVDEVFFAQPTALLDLLGEDKNMELPKEGINIKLLFSSDTMNTATISKMSRETGADFSIVWANTDKYRTGILGEIIINATREEADKIEPYLSQRNIVWEEVGSCG